MPTGLASPEFEHNPAAQRTLEHLGLLHFREFLGQCFLRLDWLDKGQRNCAMISAGVRPAPSN